MLKKIFLKIYAWLHGQSFLQAFIDKEVKDRLELVYKGFQVYGGYNFANRQQFYMFLLLQGLDIMERMYQNIKKEHEDAECTTDKIFIE